MIGYNKCKTCNNIIPRDINICPFCGSELKEAEKQVDKIENENQEITQNQNQTKNQNQNQSENITYQTIHSDISDIEKQELKKQEIEKSSIKQNQKSADFLNTSIELIKNNFSIFLLFSFLSNPLITVLLILINIAGFSALTRISLDKLFSFDFNEYNSFLLIIFIFYLFMVLLIGLSINLAYLNDFTYRCCKALLKIKESTKNNEIIEYKIYKNLNLFESLKSGTIILWYSFLYFLLPIIFLVIFYLIFQVIFSFLMSSFLCCIAFPIYIIVNLLIALIYTLLYIGFFIYLAFINTNNQKFNLIDSYKFIYNNFILNNLSNSLITISIYILFSQFVLPIIYIFFILFTLGVGLIFLYLPTFLLNTFIFSYLILNIDIN